MTLWLIYQGLKRVWKEDTAYKGIWDKTCPELGHCAITSMIIQDFCGGAIFRCPTKCGHFHYFNIMNSGEQVDLTYNQFYYTEDYPKMEDKYEILRVQLDKTSDVFNRYEILKYRLLKHLNGKGIVTWTSKN